MKNVVINSVMDLRLRMSFPYTASFTAKSSFFYLYNAGHFICNPGYYNKRSGLNGYLILYTIAGKGHALIRGKDYETVKDQILVVNCEEYHEYGTDKNDLWEFKFFTFDGSSSSEYVSIIYKTFGPVIHVPEKGISLSNIEDLIRMIQEHDVNIEIKASGMIMQILTEILLSSWQKKEDKALANGMNYIEAALEYIRSNYAQNISVKDMARAVYCSVHYFAHIFKIHTGYSPYEYLMKYRITRAKYLLEGSTASIDVISGEVGFDSASNFIKIFRESEGITPLKYRKSWYEKI